MKRLLASVSALALASMPAVAQTSPAQMGVTPTTPQALQVLDNSKTWAQVGLINASHGFDWIFQALGSATVARTAASKFNEWLSFEDLGAKGDDTADDGLTLRSALGTRYGCVNNSCPYGASPPTQQLQTFNEIDASYGATYKFTTPLTILQNRIHLMGHGATIDCAGQTCLIVGALVTSNGFEQVQIDGFKFTNCGANQCVKTYYSNFLTFARNTLYRANASTDPISNGLISHFGVGSTIEENFCYQNNGDCYIDQSYNISGSSAGGVANLFRNNRGYWSSGGVCIHLIEASADQIVGRNDCEDNKFGEVYIQNSQLTNIDGLYTEPATPGGEPFSVKVDGVKVNETVVTASYTRVTNSTLGGGVTWDIDLEAGSGFFGAGDFLGTGKVNVNGTAGAGGIMMPTVSGPMTLTNTGGNCNTFTDFSSSSNVNCLVLTGSVIHGPYIDGYAYLVNPPVLNATGFLYGNGAGVSSFTAAGTGVQTAMGNAANAASGLVVKDASNRVASALALTNLFASTTAPTFTSGACVGSMGTTNGTAAFTFNTGSGSCGSTATIGLPAAATGWICDARDEAAGAAFRIQETSDTTTSAVLTGYSIGTSPAVANFTVSHTVKVKCAAY